jgi:teichuronic acid biosynthesis glycosyltransferase TuaG
MNVTEQFVSIIMPAFNAEKYISSAIDSVLNQSFQNFELLIIDDCSTDLTIPVINEFIEIDPRVKLIKLHHNSGGPAMPRNIGIKNSSFSLIAFIDSDDIWHPQKLELQCDLMKDKQIFFCSTQAKYFSANCQIKFESIKESYQL